MAGKKYLYSVDFLMSLAIGRCGKMFLGPTYYYYNNINYYIISQSNSDHCIHILSFI